MKSGKLSIDKKDKTKISGRKLFVKLKYNLNLKYIFIAKNIKCKE